MHRPNVLLIFLLWLGLGCSASVMFRPMGAGITFREDENINTDLAAGNYIKDCIYTRVTTESQYSYKCVYTRVDQLNNAIEGQ